MTHIAKTPEPPYYAVIFTNLQSDDVADYTETAARMERQYSRYGEQPSPGLAEPHE